MIRSIAEDGSELAINMLPPEYLYAGETTVPVYFECGEDAEYAFSFEGLESFDNETEIWLEDLTAGADWVNISNGDYTYMFTASPGDAKHRFNIHFFGPTSIEEPGNNTNGKILIFSSKNEAYVVNKTNETIKEVTIYDMLGQEILRKEVPAQITNKFHVSNQTGYYVVRVLTDKQVHTGKILILK